VPDRVVIVVPAPVAQDWPASVREFAVIAAFRTAIAIASSVRAIVFAVWTIARCTIRMSLRLRCSFVTNHFAPSLRGLATTGTPRRNVRNGNSSPGATS
jgi:hypothetical protein